MSSGTGLWSGAWTSGWSIPGREIGPLEPGGESARRGRIGGSRFPLRASRVRWSLSGFFSERRAVRLCRRLRGFQRSACGGCFQYFASVVGGSKVAPTGRRLVLVDGRAGELLDEAVGDARRDLADFPRKTSQSSTFRAPYLRNLRLDRCHC